MTEDELKELTLALLERANDLTDHPAAICAAFYQGLIIALAAHFPDKAHGFVRDIGGVGPVHLAETLARGGTRQ